jgi:ABC-2 type transport system permease protein
VNKSASPLKYLGALLQTDFLVLLKNRRALIITFVVPLYIIFITSLKNNGKSTLGSPGFLVVLAITIGLLSSAIMGYALTMARDRERGVFQRLRVTPAPTSIIMISRLLMQIVASILLAAVVLAVGSKVHHLSFSFVDYLGAMLAAILGGAVFLSIAQALVGLIKSAATVNAVGSLLYAGLLLTGLLGPSGVLGTTFQNFAQWSPVGTVIAVFESAIQLTTWDSHAWLSLLACFGYIIVFTAIGIKWFQWEAR